MDFFGDWWSCCGGWVNGGSGFGVLVAAVAMVARDDAKIEHEASHGLLSLSLSIVEASPRLKKIF